MTAPEARKILEAVCEKRLKEELDSIYTDIEKAAESGEWKIRKDGLISGKAEAILRRDGFDVRVSIDEPCCVFIAW